MHTSSNWGVYFFIFLKKVVANNVRLQYNDNNKKSNTNNNARRFKNERTYNASQRNAEIHSARNDRVHKARVNQFAVRTGKSVAEVLLFHHKFVQ